MLGIDSWSLGAAAAAFAVAAALVWWAGSRLPEVASAIGRKTGLSQAFAGMLLLGGITTLPELATMTSAAATGSADLALNNAFGSAAFNMLLLVLADFALGQRALTSVLGKPATLLQGVLGMLLLGTAATVITIGDRAIPVLGVGVGSTSLFVGCLAAMWIASGYERRSAWTLIDPPRPSEYVSDEARSELPLRRLLLTCGGLAMLIFIAGFTLSQSAEVIAERTGLGSGLVGLVLLALATSLPELTAITAAVRSGHYELAVGDVFGANLFNLAMIFVIDLIASGSPVLSAAGRFEAIAALLALLMTGAFIVGLLERADRILFRLGWDSLASLTLYLGGIAILSGIGG
jgi:cation:H+ antiporter